MTAASARPPDQKLKVLFVCTHAAARSPMARALCEARYGHWVHSICAGVWPASGVAPEAAAALVELGVDLPNDQPVGLLELETDGADICAFDRVIALSQAGRDGVLAAARGGEVALEYWPMDDPLAPGSDVAAIRDALAGRIDACFAPLTRRTPR